MDGYDHGKEHAELCRRVDELEAELAERRLADGLLLERLAVAESRLHDHPVEEPEEEEEEEAEEEEVSLPEAEEESEPEIESVAEVPPERKHLLHRTVWG